MRACLEGWRKSACVSRSFVSQQELQWNFLALVALWNDRLRRNPHTGIMQTRTKYSCSRGFPRDSLPVVILCETIPEARSCIIHASASVGVTQPRWNARSAGLPRSSGSNYSFITEFATFNLFTRRDHLNSCSHILLINPQSEMQSTRVLAFTTRL